MTSQRKVALALTGIFLALFIVIIIGVLEQGRYDYAKNIAIKAALWVIYTFLEMKYNVQLSNYIRVLVMAVLLSDSFAGLYLNLYATSAIFDKIQHVFGSYAFSLFVYTLICTLTRPVINRAFSLFFIISLGLSIGAIYEIGEFIGDATMRPAIPSQPSLLDTNLDLLADLGGALLAAIHIAIVLTYNRTPPVK